MPGGSILITRAPKSDMMVPAAGPAMKLAQSITKRPLNSDEVMGAPPKAAWSAKLARRDAVRQASAGGVRVRRLLLQVRDLLGELLAQRLVVAGRRQVVNAPLAVLFD